MWILCTLLALVLGISGNLRSAEIDRYFVLPMELETDRGASNGDATLLRFMPGYN